MKSLPRPTDNQGIELSAGATFDLCLTRLQNLDLKRKFESVKPVIEQAAEEFDEKASNVNLHQISEESSIGVVIDNKDAKKLYSQQFVPEGAPGREIYLRIRNAAEHDLCPLCRVNFVKTLDHHLPKSKYSTLTVCPSNLVPSCRDCQTSKLAGRPSSQEAQTFHPYFDDFDDENWLQACIIESKPTSFRFSVKKPITWTTLKFKRAQEHFRVFNLALPMSLNAANQLRGIETRLGHLLRDGGLPAVRAHLLEEAESWECEDQNSWECAFYFAAAESDWFCGGGFSTS